MSQIDTKILKQGHETKKVISCSLASSKVATFLMRTVGSPRNSTLINLAISAKEYSLANIPKKRLQY